MAASTLPSFTYQVKIEQFSKTCSCPALLNDLNIPNATVSFSSDRGQNCHYSLEYRPQPNAGVSMTNFVNVILNSLMSLSQVPKRCLEIEGDIEINSNVLTEAVRFSRFT
jgi:hypothetical protein